MSTFPYKFISLICKIKKKIKKKRKETKSSIWITEMNMTHPFKEKYWTANVYLNNSIEYEIVVLYY